MIFTQFASKIKRRLWSMLVEHTQNRSIYPCLYRSFWHYKFFGEGSISNAICYFSACPNQGAGIGHQLANWIAGYWFAKQFGLKYAHVPFSTQKWEDLLGFGEDEMKVSELKKKGYKVRKLPMFDEYNSQQVALTKTIIKSYSGKKVVLVAEQDQFYQDQYGVINDIREKFYHAAARQNDRIIYSKETFNIAVHLRRGDIVAGAQAGDRSVLFRWQNNDYFVNVLTEVIKTLHSDCPVVIHLFSQGKQDDFQAFNQFENIQYHLDMTPYDSFLHMVYADLLITSKSSFSYKPALLNKGIKISPRDFWHGYPDDPKWILAENDGTFEVNKLNLKF